MSGRTTRSRFAPPSPPFLRHLGATPIAVAQTRRLHFAKKLIDETSLPMSQLRSPRASVRAPLQRRHPQGLPSDPDSDPTSGRRRQIQSGKPISLSPAFPPALSTGKACWRFLAARATPGVEAVGRWNLSPHHFVAWPPGYFEVSLDEPGLSALGAHSVWRSTLSVLHCRAHTCHVRSERGLG